MSLKIVVGGQFGSEAKGHMAAQLAAREDSPLVIRTGGPNAGHTVYDERGVCYKLRQLPTAAISNPNATLAIAAGSLISPVVLDDEIKLTGVSTGTRESLRIDPAATIIEGHHVARESSDDNLANWSTQKGIGAARADRVLRRARTAGEWYSHEPEFPGLIQPVAELAADYLRQRWPVIVEAAQGYGLGLHTGFYPKTTSADCRAIDALADAGISPWQEGAGDLEVWVVVRPYPIRVAGDSGELKGETTWKGLGLPEERTTVTNKVRRVGEWDPDLVYEAIKANGGPDNTRVKIALTMVDQVIPGVAGMRSPVDLATLEKQPRAALNRLVQQVQECGAVVAALGTGPSTMIFTSDWFLQDHRPESVIRRGW